ncbi:MAG: hypothetical protein U0271_41955 [Polyangiaceae bacterium]
MRAAGIGLALLGFAACGDDTETTQPGGAGGVGGGGGAPSVGGLGGLGGDGGTPQSTKPKVALPAVIDLPYVVAGAGGSTVEVVVENTGNGDATDLTWDLTGSALLSIVEGPTNIAAHSQANLTISFAGSDAETIEHSVVSVDGVDVSASSDVFAVAGDSAIGSGSWDTINNPGGVFCGEGITLDLPTAPFPYPNTPYTDASVRIFVPEGYRDRGEHDMVLHFHGHNTTLAGTLAGHLYENHLCASGVNAVLVVPQGPVNAASGDFGKLLDPGGVEAMLREVLVVLYREGRISRPVLGELTLTSHSGGYIATGVNLEPATNSVPVAQVDLFDSIYGLEAEFESYAMGPGRLRSNYTPSGGTLDNNLAVVDDLQNAGVTVHTDPTTTAMSSDAPLIYFADTTHTGSTRIDNAYGEQLRWGHHHHRRGPRIELRQAIASGGSVTLEWAAPEDDDTAAFRIEKWVDDTGWMGIGAIPSDQRSATIALTGSAALRLVPIVRDLDVSESLPSNAFAADSSSGVLVVDGFSRVIDGSWGGLSHDFAAWVAAAAGGANTVSASAITEDGFDLSPYSVVIWLTGDESVADHPLSDEDQAAISAYLAGGGHVIVSGSEIGYTLDKTSAGRAFLADDFGAAFALDASGSYSVTGTTVVSVGFAGANAAYPEEYPDAFDPTGLGVEAIAYDGAPFAAAVGVPGRSVIVGFPLELIDSDADRADVVAELIDFVTGG